MLAVHIESGVVSCRKVSRPRRPRGFALIRLVLGGICNTDLELQRGYYGFRGTPGHEFVGIVEESDSPQLNGRRVTGEINLACGKCEMCARGLGRHCFSRTVLGIVKHPGAFREFLTLPDANLHVIPDSISTDEAVFLEPLAAACEILDQVKIPRGEPVAVLGDGKLGILIAQTLQAHGARVHHYGRHRDKLRISASAGVETEIAASLPKWAYNFVVEATGSAEALNAAIGMTRPRGTLILKSTVHGIVPVDTAPLIVNELTLIGSRCGRFEPALKLLKRHRVNVTPMIAARYPLSAGPEAFAKAAEKGTLKVLLDA